MKEFCSCKSAIDSCISNKYFAIAHLYFEEKTMNVHIHDCYEIYYSISGGKQFLIDNKTYKIEPGDLFFINQYESHYLSQIEQKEHERIILSIHPEFLRSLSTEKTELDYCFLHREPGFSHRISLDKNQQQRFLYYIHKITGLSGYGEDVLERLAFTELMVFFNKEFYARTQKEEEDRNFTCQYDRQVKDILDYINANINEPITIQQLAEQFFLSKSFICRIFKQSTGTTVNKYLTARRISIAKSLLSEGASVNEVYEQCGFLDYSTFLKSFTKSVGLSPKKYALYNNRI
ncbi:MAG: transcriptional regulator, AraC family [Herbinix sp.]|nr:transcriptional regulator, AraC family [Herbinix sp.]